jgi:hypothetical protein
MGGHNNHDKLISIHNCIFRGFVDFNDAHFNGPIEIIYCQFEKGTNLLGNKGKPYEVLFDIPPRILNNDGKMDFDK